jgi:hypothetical protein
MRFDLDVISDCGHDDTAYETQVDRPHIVAGLVALAASPEETEKVPECVRAPIRVVRGSSCLCYPWLVFPVAALAVEHLHLVGVVARARDGRLGHGRFDASQIC